MKIRPYTAADFHQVLALNDATFVGDQRPPATTLQEMISVSDIWIAEEEDKPLLGFMIVRPMGDGAYLWQMSVHPGMQKRGIGGNMLREVIQYYTAKKYKHVRLHVHYDNPAQKLYFDYGFRVYDIARGYYSNEDSTKSRALMMKREL